MKWKKAKTHFYYIFQVTVNDDTFIVDGGNEEAMKELMKKEKIEELKVSDYVSYFKAPSGWLATYLEKNAKTLFDGTKVEKWRRKEK